MTTVQITRDPFARASLMRERITDRPATCRWCAAPARFRYWWESDAGANEWGRRLASPFCSVGCFRDYHA